MRTAVIRVNVDPGGELAAEALREATATVLERTAVDHIDVVDPNVHQLPSNRRELEFLVTSPDPIAVQATLVEFSRAAYGVEPKPGTLTYVSRGTDDDAHGVLAGFGLTADVERTPGADGVDLVTVRLPARALERVPESRVQTALEASLNCDVVIVTD